MYTGKHSDYSENSLHVDCRTTLTGSQKSQQGVMRPPTIKQNVTNLTMSSFQLMKKHRIANVVHTFVRNRRRMS